MNETQENIVPKRHQLSPEDKYQIFFKANMAKVKATAVSPRCFTVEVSTPRI